MKLDRPVLNFAPKLLQSAALFSSVLLILCDRPAKADAPVNSTAAAAATQPSELIGARYTSNSYGISFCPPAGAVETHPDVPNVIGEFDKDEYDWQFKVWRTRREDSLPLSTHNDQFGVPQDGLLEQVIDQIKQTTPDAVILRNEVINVGRANIGMIAVRYSTANGQRRFTQRAIVEAPDSDHRIYFFMDLTGPGKPASEPDDIVNPAEKLAYDVFSKIVDSVQVLNLRKIVEDQEQRLYDTRSMFVNWDRSDCEPVRSAVVPEQWMRIVRDGKDIGYTYVVETVDENSKDPSLSDIRVGIRSRFMQDPVTQWDTETWLKASADRKHESWTVTARSTDLHGKFLDGYTQVGASDEQTKAVMQQQSEPRPDGSLTPNDNTNNTPTIQTVRTLDIATNRVKTTYPPFKQDVPVFYIPEAFNYMLPNLLPLDRPHTYMFAAFIPTAPEQAVTGRIGRVWARYVDVLPVADVKFNGQDLIAVIPITDKNGLDGAVTTTYMSSAGKFLGSECTTVGADNKSSRLVILPSDADTLQRLWIRPDLTGPSETPDNSPPPQQ